MPPAHHERGACWRLRERDHRREAAYDATSELSMHNPCVVSRSLDASVDLPMTITLPALIQRATFLGLLALLAAAAVLTPPSRLNAQLPGLPVLQSPFSNPGLTTALDAGFAKKQQVFAGAAAFAPGSGRLVLSAGVGKLTSDVLSGTSASRTVYGARAAFAVRQFAGSAIGVGVFGGAGAASRTAGVSLITLPVGVSVGYRRALGATRAVAVHAAPFYSWTRLSTEANAELATGKSSASAGLVRVAIGADITLLPRVGLTVGFEGGGNAAAGEPGPSASIFGVALSYAFR